MNVDVKGVKYKILYKELEDDAGSCCKEKKIICIDNKSHHKGAIHRLTFTHELFHAHMRETHLDEAIESGLEEILCELVGHFIEKHGKRILALK